MFCCGGHDIDVIASKKLTAIFARSAIADQAREGLCYQKETKLNIFNTEKIIPF